ncbi:MAG TPA: glycosyltransferase, partial [Solirubrobacteraceae bacterium]|nr:glycosyltransferase [Solirubrobacteraceae bacterium]
MDVSADPSDIPAKTPGEHDDATASLHLAYVMGRYPAVSHTFILREVQALRDVGVQVDTFSIHDSGPQHVLSAADKVEYAATYVVLPPRIGRLLGAHLKAFARRPIRYLTTLGYALRAGTPGFHGRLWQLFYFAEAMVVWAECSRRGVRHLHAQFAHQAADVALLAAHFERDRGWTWSLSIHGPAEFRDPSIIRLPTKVNRAQFVICISDFTRSQVLALVDEHEWSKIHVVHCGVDPDVFSAPAQAAEHHEVDIGEPPAHAGVYAADADGHAADVGGPAPRTGEHAIDGALQVLTVGRLIPLKGHNIVIEAIEQLNRRGVPTQLTVVGDGPSRQRLVELAKEADLLDRQVRFTGAVGQDTIRDLYSEADVFCLASFGEGVPVVLMEAMAMGLPVVATRIMGIPELVEDGVSGVLVPPGRSDYLVDALSRLARTPADQRVRMGEAGRAKVMS